MTETPGGYQCYWRRIALHIGLSDAAKTLGGGIRASQLSAFERGQDHNLTQQQIEAYATYLFSQPLETENYQESEDE